MGSADACGRSLTALQDDLNRLFLNARVFYPDMQFETGTGLLYGHRFMLYARASDTLLKKLNSPLDDSLLAPALEYVYTARPGAPLTAYELLAEEWYPSLTLNDAAVDADHLRTLSTDLLAARNRRPLSDLTLVAENGQRFYVHRGLLAVRVPFFRRLLESVNVPAFFLPVTPHVTELLLSYVYGAVIDLTLASPENVRDLAYTAAYLELPGLLALMSETYSPASASAALHGTAWTTDWIAQYDQHTEVYSAFSDVEEPDDAVALRLASSANPTTESFFTFERQEDPPPRPAIAPVAPVAVSAEPRAAKKEGGKFAALFKRKKKTRPSAEAHTATPTSHSLGAAQSSKSVNTSRTTDTSHMNTPHIASSAISSIHSQASTPPLSSTHTFNDAYASHATEHNALQGAAFQHATSVESTPLHRCVFEPKHLYRSTIMASVRLLHKRAIEFVAENWGAAWMDPTFTRITQADQKHIVSATKALIRSTVDTSARLPLSAHSEALLQKYRRVPARSASVMNGSLETHNGRSVSYGRSSSAMGSMPSVAEPIRRPSTSIGGSFDKTGANVSASTRLGSDSLDSSRRGSSLLTPDSGPFTSGPVSTGSSSRSASFSVPSCAEARSHTRELLTSSPATTLLSIVSGAQALSALLSDTTLALTQTATAQIVGPLFQETIEYLIGFVLGDIRHVGALLSQMSSHDSNLTTYLSLLLCRAVSARNAVAFYDFCVRTLGTTESGSVAAVVLTPVLEHATTFIRRRYPTIASESRDASVTFADLRPEDLSTLSKAIGVDSETLRGKQYETQPGQQEMAPLSEAAELSAAAPEEPPSRTPQAKLEFFASPRARPSSEYYASRSHVKPEASPTPLLHPDSAESRYIQAASHPQPIKLRHRKSYSEDVRAKSSASQAPSRDAHAQERAFQKLQRSRLSYSPALLGTDSPLSQQPMRQIPQQARNTSGTSATSSPVAPSISSLRNMFEEDEDTSFTSVSSGISKGKGVKQRGGAGSESGRCNTKTDTSSASTPQTYDLLSPLRSPRSTNATVSASANSQEGTAARSEHSSLTESDSGPWNVRNSVSPAKSHRSNYSGRSTPVGSGVSSVSSVSTAINVFADTGTVGADSSRKCLDAQGATPKHVVESPGEIDVHSSTPSNPGLATPFSAKTPIHTPLRSVSPSPLFAKTSQLAASPRLFEPKADLTSSPRKVPASWQSNASASPRATRTSTPGSSATSSRVRDMINSINQKANGGVAATLVAENASRDASHPENSNSRHGWPDIPTRLTDASNFVPPKSVRRTSMLSFSSNASAASLIESPRLYTPARPISPNPPLRRYKRQSIGSTGHDSEDEQNRGVSRHGMTSHLLTPSENGSLQTRKSSSSIRVIASTNSRVTLGSKPVLSSQSAVSDNDDDDSSLVSWSDDDEGPAQARTRQWAGSQQVLSEGPMTEDDDPTIKIPQGMIVETVSGTVASMAGSLTGKSVAGSVDLGRDSTQTMANLSYSKKNRNSILSDTSGNAAEILREDTAITRPSDRASEPCAPEFSDHSAKSVNYPLHSSRSPSGMRSTSYAPSEVQSTSYVFSDTIHASDTTRLFTKTRQHLVEISTPPAGLRLNAGIPCVVRVLESIVVKAHIKYLGYVYGNLLDSAEETDPVTILRHKSAVEYVGVSVNKREMESKLGTHLEQMPILLDGVYKHVRYFVPNEAGERSNVSGRSRRVLPSTLEKPEDLSCGLFVLPSQIIYVL